MVAIDTHIVVRLLTQDDQVQFDKFYTFDKQFVNKAKGLTGYVVLGL